MAKVSPRTQRYDMAGPGAPPAQAGVGGGWAVGQWGEAGAGNVPAGGRGGSLPRWRLWRGPLAEVGRGSMRVRGGRAVWPWTGAVAESWADVVSRDAVAEAGGEYEGRPGSERGGCPRFPLRPRPV